MSLLFFAREFKIGVVTEGKFAAASIYGPASPAVHDGEQAKMVDSAALLD